MNTSNINKTIDKISSAVHAAKRAGINIGTDFKDNYFCCGSIDGRLVRTIDLENESAQGKLNSLLQDIYAITPANQAMQGEA